MYLLLLNSCFNIKFFLTKINVVFDRTIAASSTQRCESFQLYNITTFESAEAVAQRCSAKKLFSYIFQNSQENTWSESLFDKVTDFRRATLFKKDNGSFLRIFRNFSEHFYLYHIVKYRNFT